MVSEGMNQNDIGVELQRAYQLVRIATNAPTVLTSIYEHQSARARQIDGPHE